MSIAAPLQTSFAKSESVSFSVGGRLLQRKCTSVNHTMADEECKECGKSKQTLQRVPLTPFFQEETEGDREVPPIVHEVLRSPGQPLDAGTRSFMEPRFGHDFSQVRVHTDARAAESAHAVNALAYTVGKDVVFGANQYAPRTPAGQHLIAHELMHTLQQARGSAGAEKLEIGSLDTPYEHQASTLAQSISPVPKAPAGAEPLALPGVTPMSGPVLQRQILVGAGLGILLVSEWLRDRRNRQFLEDILASVRESPQHVGEFLTGEVWEAIRAHWGRILAVTIGLLVAEEVIAVLAAAPTGVSQIIAAILQIVVIAILGYFAAVEVVGAYEEGQNWINTARRANGDPDAITQASRSFVRMVWHIVMAVIAFAGVRARIRGGIVPRDTGGIRTGSAGTTAAEGEVTGGSVTPISSHPRFRASPSSASPTASRASAFGESSTARQLAPLEEPVPVETPIAPPVRAPAPASRTSPPPQGQGVQVIPAAAAGVSAATSTDRRRNRAAYPICWATQLGPPAQVEFIRANAERDEAEAKQARMALEWRRLRDPDFDPSEYHVHHVVPLFLGGEDDLLNNGTTIPASLHLKGHAVLRYQPQMLTPPPPLSPLPEDLYAHPANTPYEFVGFKQSREEECL